MKIGTCMKWLGILLTGVAVGCATKSTAPKSAAIGRTQLVMEEEADMVMTGSYISQPVVQNGRVNNAPYPVTVIDRFAIEHSGARDLRQLLVQQGVSR